LAIPNFLEVALPRVRRGEAWHVVVESTGVQVTGCGAWKVRRHGYSYPPLEPRRAARRSGL